MMPKLNGLEFLRELRIDGCNTPIMLLTAKSEVEDKITGLELGADDYLAKPFFSQLHWTKRVILYILIPTKYLPLQKIKPEVWQYRYSTAVKLKEKKEFSNI